MIVIVDFDLGNLGSIQNMIKKIGCRAVISRDPDVILQADKLILPGVGAFDSGIHQLEKHHLIEVLNDFSKNRKIYSWHLFRHATNGKKKRRRKMFRVKLD